PNYPLDAGTPPVILGLLNSRLLTWFYLNCLVTNLDSTPQLKNYDLYSMPIALPQDQKAIVSLVESVLSAKKKNPATDTSLYEHEIDILVYALYGLMPDEIRLV